MKNKAIQHVKCCCQLYKLQIAEGRYVLQEHSRNATSWDLEVMEGIMRLPGVERVNADQCEFGLETIVIGVEGHAKKPTGFATNSWCMACELDRQCSGRHLHFSLMEGGAARAQEYPAALCKAVCEGLQK